MLKFIESTANRLRVRLLARQQKRLRARASKMRHSLWLVQSLAAQHGFEMTPTPPRWNQNLEEILTLPIEDLEAEDADRFLKMLEDQFGNVG